MLQHVIYIHISGYVSFCMGMDGNHLKAHVLRRMRIFYYGYYMHTGVDTGMKKDTKILLKFYTHSYLMYNVHLINLNLRAISPCHDYFQYVHTLQCPSLFEYLCVKNVELGSKSKHRK